MLNFFENRDISGQNGIRNDDQNRVLRNAARRLIGPYNPAINYRALRDSAS